MDVALETGCREMKGRRWWRQDGRPPEVAKVTTARTAGRPADCPAGLRTPPQQKSDESSFTAEVDIGPNPKKKKKNISHFCVTCIL